LKSRADDSSLDHHLPALRRHENGDHADERLPVFLRMHRLWDKAEAEDGRLLRVLLLRHRALPADTGRPLRRAGGSFLLCVDRLLDACDCPMQMPMQEVKPGRMTPARNKNGL
jgi:hypothetical protein